MQTRVITATRQFTTVVFALLAMKFLCAASGAADITWDGGTGAGNAWLLAANWNPDTTPGTADNAYFGSAGTATTIGINMNSAGGVTNVNSITVLSSRASTLLLNNSSTTVNGVLNLIGTGGILLSNESTVTLTITNGTAVGGRLLGLGLTGSGDVYVNGTQAGSGGIIQIYSVISGAGNINKVGGGILYLRGVNTSTGSVTNTAGSLQFDATGTLGDGTGTLYLNGGDIICAADRSGGAPLANPVVVSGNTMIVNNAGLAGTSRTIPFSGSWSGNAGTIRIVNNTGAATQTFQARMFGSFNLSRDISIGVVPSGSFAFLQLYNSATNGIQTYSGTILDDPIATGGPGSVSRSGVPNSPPGTAIFTGANTYSGGTRISYGALLANNLSGSALGSGAVTITNLGALGGNGTVNAQTIASLGGTLSPGSTASNIANLTISDLVLGEGANYLWEIDAATGTAGVNWDLITCSSSWSDAGNSGNLITIKVSSKGVTPTGWNPAVARDWVIIQSSSANGFDVGHFTVDTSAFAGTIQGVFSLSVVSGSLHLTYTPASDIVLNVPTGSQTQTALGHPTLSGAFNVIKIGNGEAVFTNPLNDYLGETRIRAGTASVGTDALNGSGAFGNATSAVLLGNTTGNSNATLNINTDLVTVGRVVTVQAGSTGIKTISTTLTSGTATNAGDITLNDNVTLSAPVGGMLVVAGEISGTNDIIKTNGGIVALTKQNTYTGKTRIVGGTLTVDAINRLGALPAAVVDDQITLDGGTLEYTATTTASGGNRGFRIGSGGGTLSVQGGTLTINGPVSGAGKLVKVGPNRLDLNNVTNVYAGDTYLMEGDIAVDEDGTFGTGNLRWYGGGIASTASRTTTANFIANPIIMTNNTSIRTTGGTDNTSRVIIFSGSSITTTDGTLTITNGAAGATNNAIDVRFVGSGFNFTRPIVLDGGVGLANSAQLFLGNSNGSPAQTFSGEISGIGRVRRSATVTSDAGATIFTAANTYSGGTIVFAGTLLINNTSGSGTGSGAVAVNNLGVLGGTGTISGLVTVTTNAAIAPGTSAGTLTLGDGFDASAGGTYIWELAANTTSGPGVNYDTIAMSGGSVVLGGTSKLALGFIGSATAPDGSNPFWQVARQWTILTIGGSAANPGLTQFASITNTYAAGSFTNYANAGGNIILAWTPSLAPPQPVLQPNITGAGTSSATIAWSAQNGTTYTVQYKTNMNQVGWLTLGTSTASSSTASFTDTTGPHTERYYRVIWP